MSKRAAEREARRFVVFIKKLEINILLINDFLCYVDFNVIVFLNQIIQNQRPLLGFENKIKFQIKMEPFIV